MVEPKENGITYIGKCNFRGNDRVFGIKKNDRRQHMYVIGKTGVGKSALLKNMALQDIRAGRGIGIVDPHGEFVEDVLDQIPPERIRDVVYFNPVDSDYPIGFNILEVPDVKYKHLVVSDLLGIFTKIWANVWSARMEYILQNCILALIDTPGTTLLGIPRILVEKEYRDKIVANVKDPVVRSFWTQEYETWRDQFRNEAIVPIQNKVGQFLNTGFVRNIVGQPTSTLNIPDIMNTGKILLVNVSKGRIGEDNAALLGAMIITKIQLAAMERVRIPEDERLDFYLYVDEFQNFATDSFAAILSEARKYRLNLFIAHQYVGQLVTDVSTKVRDAVFGNVGTMISFRVGATDAEFLEKEYEPEFMIQDLINLPNYHIYLKLMVDGVTSRPFSAGTLAPLKYDSEPDIRQRIIDASRSQYARSRVDVEKQITQWTISGEGKAGDMPERMSQAASSGSGAPGQMYDAQCANCGKMTQVPFKPDGKRPVYCLQCLKQIEEGKLIPLPDRMPKVGRERYASTLGELGIEFESKKQTEQRPSGVHITTEGRSRASQTQERSSPQAGGFQTEGSGGVRERERSAQERQATERKHTRSTESNDRPRFMRPGSEQKPGMGNKQARDHFPRREQFRPVEQGQEQKQEQKPPVSSGSGGLRSQAIIRVPQTTQKISLGSLRQPEKREPESVNGSHNHGEGIPEQQEKNSSHVSDLGKMLEEFLTQEEKQKTESLPPADNPQIETETETTFPAPQKEKSDGKISSPKKESKVLKPGDTVTF